MARGGIPPPPRPAGAEALEPTSSDSSAALSSPEANFEDEEQRFDCEEEPKRHLKDKMDASRREAKCETQAQRRRVACSGSHSEMGAGSVPKPPVLQSSIPLAGHRWDLEERTVPKRMLRIKPNQTTKEGKGMGEGGGSGVSYFPFLPQPHD